MQERGRQKLTDANLEMVKIPRDTLQTLVDAVRAASRANADIGDEAAVLMATYIADDAIRWGEPNFDDGYVSGFDLGDSELIDTIP